MIVQIYDDERGRDKRGLHADEHAHHISRRISIFPMVLARSTVLYIVFPYQHSRIISQIDESGDYFPK